MDLTQYFKAEFAEHHDVARGSEAALPDAFAKLVGACVKSLGAGGKLMFFGNGGSAADAQHLATELTVRYRKDRAAIAAIALTTDGSALTAGTTLGAPFAGLVIGLLLAAVSYVMIRPARWTRYLSGETVTVVGK